MRLIKCDFCHKEYEIKLYSIKRSKKHYCSIECHNKSLIKKEHKILTKELLYEEYIILGQSTIKISKKYSICTSLIFRWMKKYRIPIRNAIEASLLDRGKVLSKKYLKKEYIDNKKSTLIIAKELKVDPATVRKYLLMYDIKIRNLSQSRTGNLSHRWCGGITECRRAIYRLPEYTKWQKLVYKKDNFTCQDCGKRGGSIFDIHHKYPMYKLFQDFLSLYKEYSPIDDKYILSRLAKKYKPFWDVINGCVLCKDCHKIRTKKEIYNASR